MKLEECPVPVWQNPTEFALFLREIKAREPKRILEIGAFYGGTLWQWTRLKPQVLVSIDYPVAEASSHHAAVWESRALWAGWPDKGTTFLDLIGLSSDPAIRDAAEQQGPYDFMFIDGDHSYEGVKQDFVSYLPLLTDDGCMAFHDTVRHEPGVIAFAQELKGLYPTIEYFSPDWGAGILLVFPKNSNPQIA